MWRLGVAGTTGSSPPLLAASTEYVVSGPAEYVAWFGHGPQLDAGGPVELSRFTTASGPRKTLDGSAPVVTKLSLLRVRYPISEIGSGDCVFDEYIGYVAYDFHEATFPGVDARAIVHHARLRPKNGSSEQSLLFVGDDQRYPRDVRALPIPDPGTDWMVDLDPTREYCLTLDAMPNGERGQTLVSEPLCAKVEELTRPGVDAGTSDTPASGGGGCAASGGVSRPSNGAAWCLGATLLFGARLRRRRRDGVAGTTLR
jgi:hypothetical protein